MLDTIVEKFDQTAETLSLEFHQVSVNLLEALLKLIVDRKSTSAENDEEYLERKLQTIGDSEAVEKSNNDFTRKDILFSIYMAFRKYETVVDQIAADYVGIQKIVSNVEMVRVIALILIVYLDKFSVENVKRVLFKFNPSMTKKLVKFLSAYDLEKTLCHYFDRNYVDEVLKINDKREILQQMHREIVKKDVEYRESKIPKLVCKPFKTHYEKPPTQIDAKSEEKGDQNFVFKARPVPYDILNVNADEIQRQEEEKLRRREINAIKLREEADKKMFKAAEKKKVTPATDPKETQKVGVYMNISFSVMRTCLL